MQQLQTQPDPQPNPLIGSELFSWKKWDACTHCGLCLPTCPTYRELGLETDSPRGRLYLMGAAFRDNNPMPINDDWVKYIYRCLDCRACETACPSGVHFGEVIEEARAIYELNADRPTEQRFWRRLAFKEILPDKDRLDFIFEMMWLYQRLGIRWLVQKLGILKLMGKLGEMESLLPDIPNPIPQGQSAGIYPCQRESKASSGIYLRLCDESGVHRDQLGDDSRLGRKRLRRNYTGTANVLWSVARP